MQSVVAGPLPLSRNRVRKRAEEPSTFKGKLSRTKVRRNLMEKERKKKKKKEAAARDASLRKRVVLQKEANMHRMV
ncbi:hypothetical protein K0M31_005894 [Melipona bicolor]|uniref:Uncharacterized protein n=1 Tax=Melipona bicolor TaxID=60889 RepID=A0AA40KM96_9HYME|nr:hypothetical protein K0M31_005894 [Melipona bicolor]